MKKFSGKVIHGKQLGRTIGFPTVNIVYKDNALESGTYKINGLIDSTCYSGIGVYFKDRELFEGHFFDYNQDCYGKNITIVLLKKIRENKKFDSLNELQRQIDNDKTKANNTIITGITFGTFDHFHQGHESYLSSARMYCDRLITIIARDKTVESVKALIPTHDENERKMSVELSAIPDIVELGDQKDYFSCLYKRDPDVICLGYDQHSFDTGIITRYKEQSKTIPEIIRLDSFNPEIYKSSYFR